MGRLIGFLIIIAAVLAGVWFFMPGGKDMLLDAKAKAMSVMPSKDEAEDAGDAAADAADAAVDAVEAVDEATDGGQPE